MGTVLISFYVFTIIIEGKASCVSAIWTSHTYISIHSSIHLVRRLHSHARKVWAFPLKVCQYSSPKNLNLSDFTILIFRKMVIDS